MFHSCAIHVQKGCDRVATKTADRTRGLRSCNDNCGLPETIVRIVPCFTRITGSSAPDRATFSWQCPYFINVIEQERALLRACHNDLLVFESGPNKPVTDNVSNDLYCGGIWQHALELMSLCCHQRHNNSDNHNDKTGEMSEYIVTGVEQCGRQLVAVCAPESVWRTNA